MAKPTQADIAEAAEVNMNLLQMGESLRGGGPDRLTDRRVSRLAQFRVDGREEHIRRARKAEDFIARAGYVPCDILACNCESWHPRNGWYARFQEIAEVVGEVNGKTTLAVVTELKAERGLAMSLLRDLDELAGCVCVSCGRTVDEGCNDVCRLATLLGGEAEGK